ncbi:MAG: hypothetical protein WKF77_15500 [Planctomycetaceae bacterium]
MRSRVAKGQQVGEGERFGVTLVEIQSVNHGRAFQHDSHTRMAMAVDAAFVAFWGYETSVPDPDYPEASQVHRHLKTGPVQNSARLSPSAVARDQCWLGR